MPPRVVQVPVFPEHLQRGGHQGFSPLRRFGHVEHLHDSSFREVKDEGRPRNASSMRVSFKAVYRDLFAETGGVPVPGDTYDGALINHPDTDLADAAWNTSGVPWSTLYYQGNYARLQRVTAQWDPRNVFRHALSIRAG